MRIIRKHYDTIRQAERYQNRLYSRFHYVRLIRFPLCAGETGWYVWEVN